MALVLSSYPFTQKYQRPPWRALTLCMLLRNLHSMATQFHPSVLASDVFGSAGDVTAVHRDGKVYLRKRKVGAGTLSPAQLEHLEVHRRALAAWRRLDHETQLVWNEYAREVEPHRPPFDHSSWISGQNLFVSAYHGFHTLGNEHVPSPAPFESSRPHGSGCMAGCS